MKNYIITCVCLLFSLLCMQGQDNSTELPTIIPASPTVANLMRFEEVPVDNYTGQANISIPMYAKNLQGKLSIPISLNYNTSGIRIDERSGWTGTGWSMAGEAVISRTVLGIADELDQKNIAAHYSNNGNRVIGVYHNGYYDLNWSTNPSTYYTDNLSDCNIQEFLWNSSGKGSGSEQLYPGDFDKEPDMYQLSLFGSTARFIVVKQGTELIVKMLSNDANLKIESVYNNNYEIQSFTITDTGGTQYLLDEKETSHSESITVSKKQNNIASPLSPESEMEYVSAWKISQIKTSNSFVLADFSYQMISESFETPISESRATIKDIDYDFSSVDPTIDDIVGGFDDQSTSSYNNSILKPLYTKSYTTLTINTKKISKIDFYDNTSILFARQQAVSHPEYEIGGAILEDIIILDAQNNEFKSFTLNYVTTANNRLFLMGVDEKFPAGNTLNYNLTYNEKEVLPEFGSDEKDLWGYYSGPNAPSLPSVYKLSYSANKDAVTTGVLASISYPTGGVKEFSFESNTFSKNGANFFTNDEYAFYNPDNWDPKSPVANFTNANNNNNGSSSETLFFTIQRSQKVYLSSSVSSGSTNDIANSRLRIERLVLEQQPELVAQVRLADVETFTLAPGNYKMSLFSLSIPDVNNPVVATHVKLYYKDFISALKRFIYGGGIRIKEIAFVDPNSSINTLNQESRISYEYTNSGGEISVADPNATLNIHSSGVVDGFLTNIKKYRYTKKHILATYNHGSTGGNATATAAMESSVVYDVEEHTNSVYASLTRGSYVGYGKIKVKRHNNGYSLYEYSTASVSPTYGLQHFLYPFIPQPDKSHLHGVPIKQEVYNQASQKLQETSFTYHDPIEIVQETYIHSYDKECPYTQYYSKFDQYINKTPDPSKTFLGQPSNPSLYGNCIGSQENCPAPLYYKPYNHIFAKYLLKDKISTSFYYDASDVETSATQTESYTYNLSNYQPRSIEVTDSNNNVLKTEFIYSFGPFEASDFTSSELLGITKMNALNMRTTPIFTKSYKNDVLLSSVKAVYEEVHPNVVAKTSVSVGKATNDPEKRIIFHEYDDLGNPLEVSQANGTRISYVWGYYKVHPIAKIVNASYDDATMTAAQQTAIDNAITASNLDINQASEQLFSDKLKALRLAFPNAMITTMTYDPLIGVTSSTDVRGYTTFYEYDTSHRLEKVKDADGHVLAKNQYFYKESNTSLENFVKTTAYQQATQDGIGVSDWDKLVTINYIDELGRAKQSIGIGQGGQGQDIVTHFEYDSIGRQTREFLPYAAPSLRGAIHTDALTEQSAFYNVTKYENTPNPYSEKSLEESPLNRVLEQAAPGLAWKLDKSTQTDHTIKMDYQTNTYNGTYNDQTFDNVKYFKVNYGVNGFTDVTLQENGYYLAGELYKSIVKDENWQPNQTHANNHTAEEFKDKLGRVVLKRTYNNEVRHDTHYVYDDFGNLTYVLPPEASAKLSIDATVLAELSYQYKYDYRNRLIEKKIPAKGWEYIVYDKLDRPVLTQDANLGAANKWLFTKYDLFGRVIYTGIVINTADRIALQATIDGTDTDESKTATATTIGNTAIYYTNDNYPNDASVIVLTVNYYDNYNWDTENSLEASYDLDVVGLEPNVNQNTWEKQGADSWINAGFLTDATIKADGYIEYRLGNSDKRMMVGLSHVANASQTDYSSINYRIYTGYNSNRVYVYNNSDGPESHPPIYSQAGDTFRIERFGNQILFKKNGAIFHTINISYSGTLVGSGCVISQNAILENVHIGYAVYGQAFTENTKGLPTGSKVRTIGTDKWTTTESYYDQKARAIHMASKNKYLNSQDAVSTLLDFTGKVLENKSTHFRAKNSPIVTIDSYTYDENSRLLYQTKQINGTSKELIAKHHYDDLGQLEMKQVGGSLPNISTYNNLNNVSVNGNTIAKTGTNNAWDGSLATDTNITGDGYLSFEIPQRNNSIMVGLSETVGNSSYTSIDYAIFITSWGVVKVYEKGIDKGDKSTYFTGDRFKVERRGTKIYYLKNEETFYISDIIDAGNPLLADVSIYSTDAKIKDLVLIDLEKELQEVDYTYNVRGWLKGINEKVITENEQNNDLFSFALKYNDIDTIDDDKKLFNGNISSTLWKTKGQDSSLKNYVYEYDALNRITEAVDNTGNYNLNHVTYDLNGNILELFREGHTNAEATTFGLMDKLYYSYQGNQLMKVKDDSNIDFGFKDGINSDDDYDYDANGNMTKDKNKGISSITYNYLNLPEQITFDNGSTISYIYDATGIKQEKIVNDFLIAGATYTYYAGNYIYKKSNGQSSINLTFFNSEEGYIEPVYEMTGGQPYGGGLQGTTPIIEKITGFEYTYQYKDHLGNIRLSFQDMDGNGSISPETEIKEENHYYPFGLKHKGYNNNQIGRDHKFDYLGQERHEDLGLNWIEFRYRQSDPSIGRFFGVDPISEEYYSISTYQFAHNNPVWKIEIEGLEGATVNKEGKGDIEHHEPVKSKEAFIGPGGLGPVIVTTVVQETTEKVVVETTKNSGFLKNLLKVGGRVLGTIGMIFTPTSMADATLDKGKGLTDEHKEFIKEVIRNREEELKVDESLKVDAVEVEKVDGDNDSPIKRLGDQKTSGKNGKHANTKAKESALDKYNNFKSEYESLKTKPNKTKEDKKAMEKARKQMTHWKGKADFSGENHSQRNKGN